VSAEFVWQLVDVLELSAEPYDVLYPVVCMDESPYQVFSEVRLPQPVAPGRTARDDYEYRRMGTCKQFMMIQPLTGWRPVEVTEHCTAQDFARCMKALVDEHFPQRS
jgi:hypothetical protein